MSHYIDKLFQFVESTHLRDVFSILFSLFENVVKQPLVSDTKFPNECLLFLECYSAQLNVSCSFLIMNIYLRVHESRDCHFACN